MSTAFYGFSSMCIQSKPVDHCGYTAEESQRVWIDATQ